MGIHFLKIYFLNSFFGIWLFFLVFFNVLIININNFFNELKKVRNKEAKKVMHTVITTITAPMATPGPAYACAAGTLKKVIKKINE